MGKTECYPGDCTVLCLPSTISQTIVTHQLYRNGSVLKTFKVHLVSVRHNNYILVCGTYMLHIHKHQSFLLCYC